MRKLKIGSLFAGIGGFDLGLERTGGFETAWFCEQAEYPASILKQRWPGVPVYPDVTELKGSEIEPVDILVGGFPCQDLSVAGGGAGISAGTRSGLWSEYARLIGELRPRYVIVENVAVLKSRGLDQVLADLAALGYDAEWDCVPASAVGAHHQRDRIWVVAYPSGEGLEGYGCAERDEAEVANLGRPRSRRSDPWTALDAEKHVLRELKRLRAAADACGESGGVAEPRDRGQGREPADPRESAVVRQENGEGGPEGSPACDRTRDVADPSGQPEREPADETDPLPAGREARDEPVDGREHYAPGSDVPDPDRERELQPGGTVSEVGGRTGYRCSETGGAGDLAGSERERAWPHGEPTRQGFPESHPWSVEPDVGRGLDGFSAWLDDPGVSALNEAHTLYLAYANASETDPREDLRVVRDEVQADTESLGEAGGRFGVSSSEVLLAFLCELEGRIDTVGIPRQGEEAHQDEVRSLRDSDQPASAPHRPGHLEQYLGKHPNSVSALSQVLARCSEEAWAGYRWENAELGFGWEEGIARMAHAVPDRVDRLSALGNALVPQIPEWIGERILEWESDYA